MQTAHIKLYVEMPDGMVIEHDTNKAPTALVMLCNECLWTGRSTEYYQCKLAHIKERKPSKNWWEDLMSVLQRKEVSNDSVFFAGRQEQRALELKLDQINDVLAGRSATVWLRSIEYTPDDITQFIQEQLDGSNPPKSLLWDFFDSIDSEPVRNALRKRINSAIHDLAKEAVDSMDAGEIRELIYG